MNVRAALLPIIALMAGVGGSKAAPPSAAKIPNLLGNVRDGAWELRQHGSAAIERVCVKGGVGLIQLRHPGKSCERIVVEQTASSVLVQYTCRGSGFGRTMIRRETAQLIQLETQGVANGFPFEYSAEGRWTGDCTRAPG